MVAKTTLSFVELISVAIKDDGWPNSLFAWSNLWTRPPKKRPPVSSVLFRENFSKVFFGQQNADLVDIDNNYLSTKMAFACLKSIKQKHWIKL